MLEYGRDRSRMFVGGYKGGYDDPEQLPPMEHPYTYDEIQEAEGYPRDNETLNLIQSLMTEHVLEHVEYSTIDGNFWIDGNTPLDFTQTVRLFKVHRSQDDSIRAVLSFIRHNEISNEHHKEARRALDRLERLVR